MTEFVKRFKQRGNFSLQGMRKTAVSLLPQAKEKLYERLSRGREVLEDEDLLNMYLYSYGKMHKFKLLKAYVGLFEQMSINGEEYEIFDWGCGQGLATICLLDCIKYCEISPVIRGVCLIDPSKNAIYRASEVIKCIIPNIRVQIVNKYFDDLSEKDFVDHNVKKIHLFSNILDIESYDLIKLARLIVQSFSGENLFVCVGPCYNRDRIDEFIQFIEPDNILFDVDKESTEWINDWSISLRIFSFYVPYRHPKLEDSWIDNFGARYSRDWTTLVSGPNTSVVKSMVINKECFNSNELWVSNRCTTRSGNTSYWCSFDNIQDGALMYLSHSVWADLEVVDRETVWNRISDGRFIIREARSIETGNWLMTDDDKPIMMIVQMRELLHGDWDRNSYPVFRELEETNNYSVKQGTIRIHDYAFSCCKSLRTVTFPDSVESIGDSIFEGCCQLEIINIPKGKLHLFEILLPQYKDKLVDSAQTPLIEDDLPF